MKKLERDVKLNQKKKKKKKKKKKIAEKCEVLSTYIIPGNCSRPALSLIRNKIGPFEALTFIFVE